MNKTNNRNFTTKKAVMYFIYTFVGAFSFILTYCHIQTLFKERTLQYDLIFAFMCGLTVALVNTFIRIKSGKMGEPIVNMRKYKYWAFTELVVFFFCLILGLIHLFDINGVFIIEEIIIAVFLGLFCSGVNVLHLIKKEKGCRNEKE